MCGFNPPRQILCVNMRKQRWIGMMSRLRNTANKIRFSEALSDTESKEIEKKLSEGRAGFPGLVTPLWQAFGQKQRTRSE
jgi:hypothetical protein